VEVGVPLIAPPHPFKGEDRFAEMFPEPHSTKQVEDCVPWGLETGVEAMLASMDAPSELSRAQLEAILMDKPLSR
jgi:hypothetical protein